MTPPPTRPRKLRGRGFSSTGGSLTDEVRRRVEEAAQAATDATTGQHARELVDRVQRLASAARDEAERHRPEAERAARAAADRVRDAAERAQPEFERLARQARAAGEAAAPHIARAAQDAAQYASDHDEELRGAAAQVARNVAPRSMRPAVDALGDELAKRPRAQRRDEDADEESSTDGEAPKP
ncbi:MAG: hypothetical protein F4X26_01500 [Chloroflexi bacterium]|nr:hypothetical protein [Chloroflexota bacterium]